jgi:hypothetical protein
MVFHFQLAKSKICCESAFQLTASLNFAFKLKLICPITGLSILATQSSLIAYPDGAVVQTILTADKSFINIFSCRQFPIIY